MKFLVRISNIGAETGAVADTPFATAILPTADMVGGMVTATLEDLAVEGDAFDLTIEVRP